MGARTPLRMALEARVCTAMVRDTDSLWSKWMVKLRSVALKTTSGPDIKLFTIPTDLSRTKTTRAKRPTSLNLEKHSSAPERPRTNENGDDQKIKNKLCKFIS